MKPDGVRLKISRIKKLEFAGIHFITNKFRTSKRLPSGCKDERVREYRFVASNQSWKLCMVWWITRLMLKLLVLLNPRLCYYDFDIQERSLKFNQSVCHVKMLSLTFEQPVLIFAHFWCWWWHINRTKHQLNEHKFWINVY